MSQSYFEEKLWKLLPSIYRERDETGDLAAFLRVPAPTLDSLKDLADRFPEIFGVDGCEPRYLRLLADLVGHPFDPFVPVDRERRAIREVVERYRRKATIPAIRRDFVLLGWHGQIDETFRQALRLGQRARLNRSRLPGRIYGFGVYRVTNEDGPELGGELRSALRFHHPAGTRVFFVDVLTGLARPKDDVRAEGLGRLRTAILGDSRGVFVLNRSRLGGRHKLTTRRQVFNLAAVAIASAGDAEASRARVCQRVWEARRPGLRLNAGRVGTRLVNLWLSERRSSVCCEVETRRRPPVTRPAMRLNAWDQKRALLNRTRLNRATRACLVGFRQRDLVGGVDGSARAAKNLFVAITLPPPPTVSIPSGADAGPLAASNVMTAIRFPAA